MISNFRRGFYKSNSRKAFPIYETEQIAIFCPICKDCTEFQVIDQREEMHPIMQIQMKEYKKIHIDINAVSKVARRLFQSV